MPKLPPPMKHRIGAKARPLNHPGVAAEISAILNNGTFGARRTMATFSFTRAIKAWFQQKPKMRELFVRWYEHLEEIDRS